jgi:hypothetical protein
MQVPWPIPTERVQSVSDRMMYIVLRDQCYDIIVLNGHALIEDKSYDSKDSVYEELEQVFNKLPKHHRKNSV